MRKSFKLLLGLLLAVLMVASVMTVGVFAEDDGAALLPLEGSGTEADPYRINDLDDLVNFSKLVNAGSTFAGEYVELTADIDLTGVVWTPIGTSNYDKAPDTEGVKMFAGNFDGGDHTITGLSSDGYVPAASETGSTEYSFGLFGYVYGANISNVKLANVDINGGTRTDSEGNEVYGSGVAALIGYYFPADETATVIENCHVLNGTVKASNNMGGLIGHLDSQTSQPKVDITIENCSNAADVTTEAREAGGILGLMNSAREGNYYVTMSGTVTFKDCVNTGAITSLGGGAPSAGGILGRDHNQASGQRLKIVFDGCENSGTITVTANGETHAAGIGAGYYSAGAWLIAKNCTNTGDVVVSEGNSVYAGGLISYGGVVELIDCTSTSSVTVGGSADNTYVGGAQSILFLDGIENFSDTVNGYIYWLNGGTSPEYAALVDDAAYGGNFHLVETAYKDYCEFLGWYDNPEFTGNAYTALSGNVKTYYAKWKVIAAATVGGVNYETLQAAIDAATAGQTVTLLTDVTLTETLTIPANKTVVLDLNGKTISQEKACTASYSMIENKGSLTIKDEAGNGKISFKDTSAGDPSFGWGSYTIHNSGTLVVENGTIEHLGEQAFATHCIMAIFQYSGSTTIKGGTISTPNYRSLRLWSGDVTIEGGTFDGQVWVQCVNNTAKLTVNGGSFSPNGRDGSSVFVGNSVYTAELSVTGGTFETKIGANNADALAGAITGGSFTEAAKNGTNAALIGEDVKFGDTVDENGYYGIVEKSYAAEIVGGKKYESLDEALDAAKDGDTVYIFAGSYEQDLNVNKAITVIGETTDTGYQLVEIIGQVRVTADGAAVKGLYVYDDDTGLYINAKDVLIEGCEIVGAGWAGLYQSYTNGTVTFKDSVIVGSVYGINFDGSADGNIVIEGCTIQGWTSFASTIDKVTIKDSFFSADSYYKLLRFYQDAEVINTTFPAGMRIDSGNAGVGMSGITLNFNDCTVDDGSDFESVFPGSVIFASNVIVDDEKLVRVAMIGDTYYATLSEAFAAAENGDTITLLADIALSEMIVNKMNVTLDLNGKTITGTDTTSKNFSLIDNRGTLTITGNGTITLTATTNSGWNRYSAVIANNPGGKLIIENGTLEHLGGTDMAYGIDNLTNGKGTYAETVINGGTIKSTYRGIRQFLNGIEAQNILTINGGTIEGANKSVWMQDPNKNANSGSLTIGANASLKGDVYLFVTAGSTEWPVQVSINASALKDGSVVMTGNIPAGYGLANVGGTYGVFHGVAKIGNTYYETLAEAFKAAQDGDEVVILVAGTYTLSTSGKDITITGDVDGVVFDNIGAKNMGGANVTFNNVTFDYYPNVNYTGLQHSGNLVYNNCTFNGQVFLYGASETFNGCTFNQNSKDAYNVWTYGAKAVDFVNCTFNSVGKSVLIYAESASITNDVTVTDCDFIASAPVDGKAAIEMDSSLTAGIKLTIDAATTATGFANGNVSGNSLWNNKKWDSTDANNDITVSVAGETVLAPVTFVAKIGNTGYTSLAAALAAAKDQKNIVIDLVTDATLDITAWQTLAIGGETTETITINGNGNTLTFNKLNSDWNHVATNNDAKLILNNMKITDSGYNNGPWNRYDINFACDVELNNVVSTKALAFKADAALKDVTVNETGDNYAIWIQANGQTVTIDGLTVESAGRGIKIDEQYVDASAKVVLSVSNATFTTAKKAAILVKNAAGADITLSNVDISNVAANKVNAVWVDSDAAQHFGKVTVTGGALAQEDVETFIASLIKDGAVVGYYKTLQAAIDACSIGDNTVQLLNKYAEPITEDVTIKQTEGVNITIDGELVAGGVSRKRKYSGTITIHGNARYEGAETLTIKNIDFITSEAGHYFIDSNSTGSVERYAHNVTISDCSFTAVKGSAAEHTAVAVRIRQGYNITIEAEGIARVTAQYMHSLFQGYGCNGVTFNNVNVNYMKNGISVGTSENVVFNTVQINIRSDAAGYGIRADGTDASEMIVKDANINAKDPIVIRNASGAYKLTLEGTNKLTAGNEKGYQVIFTAGDDGTYELPTGEVTLIGGETLKVYPLTCVTVTLDDVTVVMGNKLPDFTYQLSNPALADKITVTFDAINYTAAGTYTITATVVAPENYEVTVVNGTLTVTECVVTVDGIAYDNWNDAKAAIKRNSVIKLYADIEYGIDENGKKVEHKFPTNGGNIVIDLNGHNLTYHYAATIQFKTVLTVTDTSNGTPGKLIADYAANPFVISPESSLELTNGVIFEGNLQLNGPTGKAGYLSINGQKVIGNALSNSPVQFTSGYVRIKITDNFSNIQVTNGTLQIAENCKTPANQTVILNAGTSLIVPEGVTLNLDATTDLVINGTLNVEGTLVVNSFEHFKQFLNMESVKNLAVGSTIVIDEDYVLDLAGRTILVDGLTGAPAFRVLADVTVKNGTVDATAGVSSYAFIVGNSTTAGKLTVENGNYYGRVTAISVTLGDLIIKDGYFEATEYNGAREFTINCIDANYRNGTATVTITGGTFYGFDPQNNASEGKGTNYLTAGYATVNENGVYTVVPAVAAIGNVGYLTLQDAVAAAKDGDVIILLSDLTLSKDDVTLLDGSYNTFFLVEGKDITIDLNGKTISVDAAGMDKMLVGVFSTDNGGHLTLNDTVGGAVVEAVANGATVYGLIVNYEPGCSITINGGTYTLDKASDSLIYTGCDAGEGEGVVVNGGNFTLGNVGTGKNQSPWIFNAKGQNTANVIVTGGTFNANICGQYYAHEVDILDAMGNLSYVIANADGTWTVTGLAAEVAIMLDVVGNYDYPVGYATFADAIKSIVKGQAETTIVLQKDITVKGQFIGHSYAQNVVIDLNGFKMSSTDKALTVYRAGTTVLLKNGTVHGNTTGGTIQVTYGGKLILGENVTITCGGSANALKVDANSTLIIADETVKVLGGKNDLVVAEKATVEISAGFFKHPVNAEWCAEGYFPITVEGGYSVATGACAIGDTVYNTLGEAIEAAKDGDTIVLVNDVNVSFKDAVAAADGFVTLFKVEGKTITIDLNGKTILGDATGAPELVGGKSYPAGMLLGMFTTLADGHLTLVDSSNGLGTVELDSNGYLVYGLIVNYDNDCSVVIEGGNYVADDVFDALVYTSCDEGVVVNGGNFHLANIGQGTRGNGSPWIFNGLGQNITSVVVNGGTFNANVNAQYWVFEVKVDREKALKDNGDGTWTVVDAVAYVNDQHWASAWYTRETGYATEEEAYAACEGVKRKVVGKKVYDSAEEFVTILDDDRENIGEDYIPV